MAGLNYYNDFFNVTFGQRVISNCAEIAFYNQGTATLVVQNSIFILPGGLFSCDGKAGEMDTTNYIISFSGAGTQDCVVIRKYYQGASSQSYNVTI